MPPPCKPFWSKNHAIRPCSDAFQGNPYSGNLPFFGKFRTNRQLAGMQEPYSLHIVEGNGPGSSGAGWNGGGRVQNKPNMLYESRQTRPGQPAAKKYGTVSADLMREYGLRLEKTCKSLLVAVRLQADSQTPGSPPAPAASRRDADGIVGCRDMQTASKRPYRVTVAGMTPVSSPAKTNMIMPVPVPMRKGGSASNLDPIRPA